MVQTKTEKKQDTRAAAITPDVTYKDWVVFSKANEERIRNIIVAGGDPAKLAAIPPSFIVIDLTWSCNYGCVGCVEDGAVNRQGVQNLPIEIIEDIFDYSAENGVRGIMTMGGEVFVYGDGIRKAMEKSIQHQIPLKTVTNGSKLEKYVDDVAEAYKIDGSVLRVSINADRQNYSRQVRRNVRLEPILEAMKEVSSRGVHMYVSTVVFPEASAKHGFIPNVHSLKSIIKDCEDADVGTHLLLPARDPETKKRYGYNAAELAEIRDISGSEHSLELITADIVRSGPRVRQNLNYSPCPSNFFFTLVGSDGRVYKCTDNRGRESAVLGEIKMPGGFGEFWHSRKRVEKQMSTPCPNKGCVRYKVNVELDCACKAYQNNGVNMAGLLLLPENYGGKIPIFT